MDDILILLAPIAALVALYYLLLWWRKGLCRPKGEETSEGPPPVEDEAEPSKAPARRRKISRDCLSQDSGSPGRSFESSSGEATIAVALGKTRRTLFGRLSEIFSRGAGEGDELYEKLEELLLSSDIGVRATRKLLSSLKEEFGTGAELDESAVRKLLRSRVLELLKDDSEPSIDPKLGTGGPKVILVVGVNGVGKTTTIGKLAYSFAKRGVKILIGACDTFRAAAVEQLGVLAERASVDMISGDSGAKPSTVAYKAVHRAMDEAYDVVMIDTAGRLHTRVNLMNELASVVSIIEREMPGAPHEIVLVVDASTGQNALQQAREFNAKGQLTGIVVTKLDGTAKGGIVVAIRDELGIPIRYVGVGEGAQDLKPFDPELFVAAIFDEGS